MILSAVLQPDNTMSRHQQRTPFKLPQNVVEVKSKFDAEYRRFALKRSGAGSFQEFYRLLQSVHHIPGTDLMLGYADIHGDLLPINNDDNFQKAVSSANPLLRIILTRKEDEPIVFATNSLQRRKKGLGLTGLRPNASGSTHQKNKPGLMIGLPQDFRQISSIIDVDILPESHRRVRLHKHGTRKPLGFYIRDGVSVRVTPQGVEKVPGVFISRLVRGGLAESTGLLGVNDEILEVNGIDVAGKSLDQVTDMMVANSHNLIVTVKPANQRNNVLPRGSKVSAGNASVGSGSTGSALSCDSPSPVSHSNPITASDSIAEGYSEEEDDDDGDLIIENDNLSTYIPHNLHSSNNGNYSRDSLGRLGSVASSAPLAHSASMPSSFVTSTSDTSMTTVNQNGSPAHTASSSSQESMREDGNSITL